MLTTTPEFAEQHDEQFGLYMCSFLSQSVSRGAGKFGGVTVIELVCGCRLYAGYSCGLPITDIQRLSGLPRPRNRKIAGMQINTVRVTPVVV